MMTPYGSSSCYRRENIKSYSVETWFALVKVKLKLCYQRRSVGQSVLVSGAHLRPVTRFLLLSDSYLV
jgi:hypothetical protein